MTKFCQICNIVFIKLFDLTMGPTLIVLLKLTYPKFET